MYNIVPRSHRSIMHNSTRGEHIVQNGRSFIYIYYFNFAISFCIVIVLKNN